MEFNKLCRTCLSASEDMTSLYETCATFTPICCAEMLSIFTPILYCKGDGLPTMICHNCVREVNRCYTFRLKCLRSDGVLRKRVPRVIGVAATNMTVTNQHTESRNQHSINVDADMDEDCCIFEEVSIKNEYPTSSKKELSATSLNDPLSLTEMQEDMNQALDIVKHEVNVVGIKIETDDDINEVNNAPVNEQEKKKDTYPCTMCRRTYKKKTLLTIHMRSHTGEKPYSCTICNLSFVQDSNLNTHMRTHTGEKPYSCKVCHITCIHLSTLTRHMRTHTGEKPYLCTVCPRSFTQPQNLSKHKAIHTRGNPVNCRICNSSFKSITPLTYHMLTHQKKPYACTVCDSAFNSQKGLTMHKRRHLRENSKSLH